MKVLHINQSDSIGGSARAAYRIHRSFVDHGTNYNIQSQMRVISKRGDDYTVIGGPAKGIHKAWPLLLPTLNKISELGFSTNNTNFHSTNWIPTGLGYELRQRFIKNRKEIIQLYWLGNQTISIRELAQIRQPVVWTLFDQWPFSGAEHYSKIDNTNQLINNKQRYSRGYLKSNRPLDEKGLDINRRVWLHKKKCWKKPFQIVCPSKWLADCARKSNLMANWPIKVIPIPINLKTWAPLEKKLSRKILDLPINKPLILFGAIGGTKDLRKGANIMIEALELLRKKISGNHLSELELVIFGQTRPVDLPEIDLPIHYAGHFHDEISLRLLYCASDVLVVPSILEGFGQTASEAHACGTPVIAFKTGGLLDVVEDKVTGSLADPFDPNSLAQEIHWILEEPNRALELGFAARKRAENLWSPERITKLYHETYQEMKTFV